MAKQYFKKKEVIEHVGHIGFSFPSVSYFLILRYFRVCVIKVMCSVCASVAMVCDRDVGTRKEKHYWPRSCVTYIAS